MAGAGILVRDRWDTMSNPLSNSLTFRSQAESIEKNIYENRSFVFKDEEHSKLAYNEFEQGEARQLLRQHAQWDLYVAVKLFSFLF